MFFDRMSMMGEKQSRSFGWFASVFAQVLATAMAPCLQLNFSGWPRKSKICRFFGHVQHEEWGNFSDWGWTAQNLQANIRNPSSTWEAQSPTRSFIDFWKCHLKLKKWWKIPRPSVTRFKAARPTKWMRWQPRQHTQFPPKSDEPRN